MESRHTPLFTMNVGPLIQTIEPNSVAKEEEVDELLADADDDEWEYDENEISDPNEFRVHDPLPEYREYKRNLSEVHSTCGPVLCVDNPSDVALFRNGSFK
jgi:hypothetical protein